AEKYLTFIQEGIQFDSTQAAVTRIKVWGELMAAQIIAGGVIKTDDIRAVIDKAKKGSPPQVQQAIAEAVDSILAVWQADQALYELIKSDLLALPSVDLKSLLVKTRAQLVLQGEETQSSLVFTINRGDIPSSESANALYTLAMVYLENSRQGEDVNVQSLVGWHDSFLTTLGEEGQKRLGEIITQIYVEMLRHGKEDVNKRDNMDQHFGGQAVARVIVEGLQPAVPAAPTAPVTPAAFDWRTQDLAAMQMWLAGSVLSIPFEQRAVAAQTLAQVFAELHKQNVVTLDDIEAEIRNPGISAYRKLALVLALSEIYIRELSMPGFLGLLEEKARALYQDIYSLEKSLDKAGPEVFEMLERAMAKLLVYVDTPVTSSKVEHVARLRANAERIKAGKKNLAGTDLDGLVLDGRGAGINDEMLVSVISDVLYELFNQDLLTTDILDADMNSTNPIIRAAAIQAYHRIEMESESPTFFTEPIEKNLFDNNELVVAAAFDALGDIVAKEIERTGRDIQMEKDGRWVDLEGLLTPSYLSKFAGKAVPAIARAAAKIDRARARKGRDTVYLEVSRKKAEWNNDFTRAEAEIVAQMVVSGKLPEEVLKKEAKQKVVNPLYIYRLGAYLLAKAQAGEDVDTTPLDQLLKTASAVTGEMRLILQEVLIPIYAQQVRNGQKSWADIMKEDPDIFDSRTNNTLVVAELVKEEPAAPVPATGAVSKTGLSRQDMAAMQEFLSKAIVLGRERVETAQALSAINLQLYRQGKYDLAAAETRFKEKDVPVGEKMVLMLTLAGIYKDQLSEQGTTPELAQKVTQLCVAVTLDQASTEKERPVFYRAMEEMLAYAELAKLGSNEQFYAKELRATAQRVKNGEPFIDGNLNELASRAMKSTVSSDEAVTLVSDMFYNAHVDQMYALENITAFCQSPVPEVAAGAIKALGRIRMDEMGEDGVFPIEEFKKYMQYQQKAVASAAFDVLADGVVKMVERGEDEKIDINEDDIRSAVMRGVGPALASAMARIDQARARAGFDPVYLDVCRRRAIDHDDDFARAMAQIEAQMAVEGVWQESKLADDMGPAPTAFGIFRKGSWLLEKAREGEKIDTSDLEALLKKSGLAASSRRALNEVAVAILAQQIRNGHRTWKELSEVSFIEGDKIAILVAAELMKDQSVLQAEDASKNSFVLSRQDLVEMRNALPKAGEVVGASDKAAAIKVRADINFELYKQGHFDVAAAEQRLTDAGVDDFEKTVLAVTLAKIYADMASKKGTGPEMVQKVKILYRTLGSIPKITDDVHSILRGAFDQMVAHIDATQLPAEIALNNEDLVAVAERVKMGESFPDDLDSPVRNALASGMKSEIAVKIVAGMFDDLYDRMRTTERIVAFLTSDVPEIAAGATLALGKIGVKIMERDKEAAQAIIDDLERNLLHTNAVVASAALDALGDIYSKKIEVEDHDVETWFDEEKDFHFLAGKAGGALARAAAKIDRTRVREDLAPVYLEWCRKRKEYDDNFAFAAGEIEAEMVLKGVLPQDVLDQGLGAGNVTANGIYRKGAYVLAKAEQGERVDATSLEELRDKGNLEPVLTKAVEEVLIPIYIQEIRNGHKTPAEVIEKMKSVRLSFMKTELAKKLLELPDVVFVEKAEKTDKSPARELLEQAKKALLVLVAALEIAENAQAPAGLENLQKQADLLWPKVDKMLQGKVVDKEHSFDPLPSQKIEELPVEMKHYTENFDWDSGKDRSHTKLEHKRVEDVFTPEQIAQLAALNDKVGPIKEVFIELLNEVDGQGDPDQKGVPSWGMKIEILTSDGKRIGVFSDLISSNDRKWKSPNSDPKSAVFKLPADAAMLGTEKDKKLGGIDLDGSKMEMELQGDAQISQGAFDIDLSDAVGFEPVIIEILPAEFPPALLQLAASGA
ncbi:MAG TPA: hypothetical protein VLJ10_01495, partial [Candidatus Bathyarchaeia archaeon]|nr:hypothetical protein [Candidatus Bathyarchaeia archaeon]